jgi:hypothetical protein
VRLRFRVALDASDAGTAREIAHRAVRCEQVRDYDVFEPELAVGEPEAGQLRRAG